MVSPVDADGPLAGDLAGIVDTLAAVRSHPRISFGARIGAMLLGAMTAAAQQSPSVKPTLFTKVTERCVPAARTKAGSGHEGRSVEPLDNGAID